MIERDLMSPWNPRCARARGDGFHPARTIRARELRSSAYEDRPLSIGEGQTISQPYIVAFMTELLSLKGTERVLEIGTGSGYQTAVLGKLAAEVYSIEILPKLSERARILLGSSASLTFISKWATVSLVGRNTAPSTPS